MVKMASLALVAAFLSLNLHARLRRGAGAAPTRRPAPRPSPSSPPRASRTRSTRPPRPSRRRPASRCRSAMRPRCRSPSRSRPGAPADIFVSADTASADYLSSRGLLKEGTRVESARQQPRPRRAEIAGGKKIALEKGRAAGRARRQRPHRHRRSGLRAGRQIRQGGAAQASACGRLWSRASPSPRMCAPR